MNQGLCIMNDTQPECKCFMEYSGIKCETMSNSLAVKKAIINVSTIIAILVLACFIALVLFFDYTKHNAKTNRNFISMKPEFKNFRYHPLKKRNIIKPE
jgi:amino acid transporter